MSLRRISPEVLNALATIALAIFEGRMIKEHLASKKKKGKAKRVRNKKISPDDIPWRNVKKARPAKGRTKKGYEPGDLSGAAARNLNRPFTDHGASAGFEGVRASRAKPESPPIRKKKAKRKGAGKP